MVQIFEEFKDYIITGIISIITGSWAYFQGKRTKEAETKQAEGSALETIQLVYDKFAQDTKARLDEQHYEILKMKEDRAAEKQEVLKEKDARDQEVKILKDKIKSLIEHVAQLQLDLEDCRKSI
jgi:hypothetical protein